MVIAIDWQRILGNSRDQAEVKVKMTMDRTVERNSTVEYLFDMVGKPDGRAATPGIWQNVFTYERGSVPDRLR